MGENVLLSKIIYKSTRLVPICLAHCATKWSVERHHHYLIETGLTLLADAFFSYSYWPHAFQTAAYLINRMSTDLLQNKSPFEALIVTRPNYRKVCRFGCLYFPLTKPCNSNKHKTKSVPSFLVGYSYAQNTYFCEALSTQCLNLCHHVLFNETNFPFAKPYKT